MSVLKCLRRKVLGHKSPPARRPPLAAAPGLLLGEKPWAGAPREPWSPQALAAAEPRRPGFFMHARELVELAAICSAHGAVLIRGTQRLSSSGVQQYWTESKCRLDRWFHSLRTFTHEAVAAGSDGGRGQWPFIRSVLEEIITGEMLTRVWASPASLGWACSGSMPNCRRQTSRKADQRGPAQSCALPAGSFIHIRMSRTGSPMAKWSKSSASSRRPRRSASGSLMRSGSARSNASRSGHRAPYRVPVPAQW